LSLARSCSFSLVLALFLLRTRACAHTISLSLARSLPPSFLRSSGSRVCFAFLATPAFLRLRTNTKPGHVLSFFLRETNMCACMYVYVYVCVCVCVRAHARECVCVCLCVFLSVSVVKSRPSPSACLPICLSLCLSVCLSASLSVCLSVCLSVSLSA